MQGSAKLTSSPQILTEGLVLTDYFRSTIESVGRGQLIPVEPHAAQKIFLSSNHHRRLIVAHRRWGKDWATILDILARAKVWAKQPWRARLSPRVSIGIIYPTYPLVNDFWEALKRIVPASEVAEKYEASPRRMVLKNGAQIEVRSGSDPDMLVAAGYDLAVLGEAALLPHASWLAVMPMLASPGRGPEGEGGMAVLQSTPRGQNWFARELGSGNWWTLIAPFYTPEGIRHENASPLLAQEEVEAQRKQMPARWFNQEYLCELLSGEGQIFRNVKEHIAPAPDPPQAPIIAGVDLAKHRDFTVCTAFDGLGHMVDMERMNQLPYTQQAERICSFLIRNRAEKVVVESNGPGDPFCEMLEKDMYERAGEFPMTCELLPFVTTAPSKRQMIDALVVAFERSMITILDEPQLVSEFEAFMMDRTSTGHERFSAPEGGWDDCVMSCGLAWTEVMTKESMMTAPDMDSNNPLDDLNIGEWWRVT